MNYLRNDMTGAQYNFDSMPQNQNALMGALDYTSGPVDVNGRKGYRLKSDGMTVVFDDGSKAMLGVDRKASREANMGNLEMEKAGLANKLLQAQITAAGQKEGPTYQHVDTPNGIMAFNPKTGQLVPTGASGGQMQSKEQIQRSSDATSAMELTDQASPLIDTAPGSYIGAGLNQLGRVVGLDTEASKAQAQLGVIGGALVSKMPKMSGPQSDKDVALYKQMAGNLDDPTLPSSAKNAAIQMIRLLNKKYATGYVDPSGAVREPAGGRPPLHSFER